jgi:dUTP pyrophosphatase
MVTVKIINKSKNELPSYMTEGSAGMDLRANLTKDVVINPLERKSIPTGIFIELPDGYEAQIRPRSGMAVNSGLTVINTPGTVDSDYRGEIIVCIVNLSEDICAIRNGNRIAQMIIAKYEKVNLLQVEELSNTERNEGGFGHTGK